MTDIKETRAEFQRRSAELCDLLCALNALTWDARTQMPSGGSRARAHQLATLSAITREKLLEPDFACAAEGVLANSSAPDLQIRAARQALEAIGAMGRVPAQLTRELALLRSEAQDGWAVAKGQNNFVLFAPTLERMVDLTRELAEALGYADHPYDALLNLYEPGMTLSSLEPLFSHLREHHLSLLERIREKPEPRSDFLERHYPAAQQRKFALEAAQRFGYDLERGRLDNSAHPFEISFTRDDVRITTRVQEHFLPGALFGALHETGHALYEQGVSPDLSRTVLTCDLLGLYAVGGASYGVHESQSRLWENRIGRSSAYWNLHFSELRAAFPQQLEDVNAQTFVRAINRAKPSLIRVEADELTYDLHILLRVDLERQLIGGELSVKDLPEAWNARVQANLGLEVPGDAHGVLQDIHWSAGMFGSFATYTLGNVMASQFFGAAQSNLPDLHAQLEAGNYTPLRDWLTENIYRHGRTYSPLELLERITGGGLDAQPYLEYLTEKYSRLYGLEEKV